MGKNIESLAGQAFGLLTVIERSENISNCAAWRCLCQCGNYATVKGTNLRSGKTKSCGCLKGRKGMGTMSTDEFLQRSRDIHGHRYDYSRVVYEHSQIRVEIVCTEHGSFFQTPAVHLSGSGCRHCAFINVAAKKTMTTEEFVAASVAVHDDKYDYSRTIYTGSGETVEIVCKEHGSFFQKATIHLATKDCCPKCRGKILSFDDFVSKAKAIHGDVYDYSLVRYIGSKQKVDILCKDHGVFQQTPHNHTAGKHGCPTCGACGFDRALQGYLYILKDGDVVKIGITNRDVKDRVSQINSNSGKSFEVITSYSMPGAMCAELERSALRILAAQYEQVTERYDGYTECFYNVDTDKLKDTIEKILRE